MPEIRFSQAPSSSERLYDGPIGLHIQMTPGAFAEAFQGSIDQHIR